MYQASMYLTFQGIFWSCLQEDSYGTWLFTLANSLQGSCNWMCFASDSCGYQIVLLHTHKKCCFSMFQFLDIRFTKKNICTTFYNILLCLQWVKAVSLTNQVIFLGKGNWLLHALPWHVFADVKAVLWCPVRLVKSRFSILAVASNHTLHFKPACSGLVNLLNRSDTTWPKLWISFLGKADNTMFVSIILWPGDIGQLPAAFRH